MGIIDSVLQAASATPHKAAQGLLDALSPPVRAYGKYAKGFGKYSGATQMGSDALWAVTHPRDNMMGRGRAQGKLIGYDKKGRPMYMKSLEIPVGPGKALSGALARMSEKGVPKDMLQAAQDARHVVNSEQGVQFVDARGNELAPGALAKALAKVQPRQKLSKATEYGHDPGPVDQYDPFTFRFPGLVTKKGRSGVAVQHSMHHDSLRHAMPDSVDMYQRGFPGAGGKQDFDMELHMYDTAPDGTTPARIMAGLYNGTRNSVNGVADTTMTTPARMRGLTRTLHALGREGVHLKTPTYTDPPLLAKTAKYARQQGHAEALSRRKAADVDLADRRAAEHADRQLMERAEQRLRDRSAARKALNRRSNMLTSSERRNVEGLIERLQGPKRSRGKQ